MTSNDFDQRFFRAALDGLKAYRLTEFTTRFLKKQEITIDDTLQDMWTRIEDWLNNDASKCQDLWEYVDDLRLWGRQRISLYEVEEDYAVRLSEPQHVKEIAGSVYEQPLFEWEADEPFLALVEYRGVPNTEASRLVFKLIENRNYTLLIDGQPKTFEERSTNFFIINLQSRHAELRIQDLPTGAVRDIREERKRLETLIGNYLDFEKFEPIDITPVMDVMLRAPIYTITGSRLKFSEPHASPDAPKLVAFLNSLFRRPDPVEVTAFWDCNQKIMGKSELHFRLSGASNFIGIAGIADADRVNDILGKIVDIKRNPKRYITNSDGPPPSPTKEGIVAKPLKNLEDHPKAQAVVLSAGAIAASIIWVVADALGEFVFEETMDVILRGLPVAVIIVPIEIAWIIFYYGWSRVCRGFQMLWSLHSREVWKALREARKRSIIGE